MQTGLVVFMVVSFAITIAGGVVGWYFIIKIAVKTAVVQAHNEIKYGPVRKATQSRVEQSSSFSQDWG